MNPKPAVIQLTMTSPKIYDFILRNILSQNKRPKVKNDLLLTNEGGKPDKRLKKDRKYSKYTSEETVAMETSLIIDTSLARGNFL